jgi:uncharacterized protein YukE
LPALRNRQDVRLFNNRILPFTSELVSGWEKSVNEIVMSDTKEKRTRFVGLRFTQTEHEKIIKRSGNTTTPEISEYIRRILFSKEITFKQRNQSLDEFMTEMILLRNELNAIGNNFNQAVKKLHSLHQIAEFRTWISSYESDKQQLLNKVSEIKNRINQISDEWLQ